MAGIDDDVADLEAQGTDQGALTIRGRLSRARGHRKIVIRLGRGRDDGKALAFL